MPNQAGLDDHNGDNAERIASGYDSIDRRKAFPALYKILDQAAADNKQLGILDIGTGAGHDAIEMAKLGHHVVGIDPTDMLKIAIRERSHPNIDYRVGGLPKLDGVKPGEKFDMVTLCASWQYIAPGERVDSLLSIAQALKPDGKLILEYPYPPSRVHQFEISPETLQADIDAANVRLPQHQRLSISGNPVITPDPRNRKSLDGRELNFYGFTIETGRAHAISARDSWTSTI